MGCVSINKLQTHFPSLVYGQCIIHEFVWRVTFLLAYHCVQLRASCQEPDVGVRLGSQSAKPLSSQHELELMF